MACSTHITKPEDLVTSYTETRAGFIAIALEKKQKGNAIYRGSKDMDAFNKNGYTPYLFFVGAAIENKMATELFDNLRSKYINNAANLRLLGGLERRISGTLCDTIF